MRRLLSLALALTVAALSAAAPEHLHAYAGHAHLEHQHGPATHTHEHGHHDAPGAAVEDHHDDHDSHRDGSGLNALRVEACNAGDHAVRVSAAAALLPPIQLQLAIIVRPVIIGPTKSVRIVFAPLDVRVHGPPPGTRLPARAPPLTSLA